MANKRISKSTLSMFLRTKCDRELYLSLHEDSELDKHGMPVPLRLVLALELCKQLVATSKMNEMNN